MDSYSYIFPTLSNLRRMNVDVDYVCPVFKQGRKIWNMRFRNVCLPRDVGRKQNMIM